MYEGSKQTTRDIVCIVMFFLQTKIFNSNFFKKKKNVGLLFFHENLFQVIRIDHYLEAETQLFLVP